jgi:membrane-bound serine protease (ClpP class)
MASFACAGGVKVVEVRGTINPGSAAYIVDSLNKSGDASLFVIELDTPGGLIASTRTIIQGISESPVPVVVWVTPSGASATSAGSLIALSAHAVAMHDGTNLGAAHPVGGGGEDIPGVMGEKVTNDTAALARAQAALRGRNVEAAEQIVTKSQSFSATEAVQKHLADFVANDIESLLQQIDGKTYQVGNPAHPFTVRASTSITYLEMSPKQRFLHFIADPNISTILLSVGSLAVWAEVSSGFSSIAAGVVGIFCFVLGLVSLQTLPVNTGGEILLCLGFMLLVADALVTQHGLLSIAAIISIFFGGLFLIDPSESSIRVSLSLLIPLVTSMGLIVALVGYLLTRDQAAGKQVGNLMIGSLARVDIIDASECSGKAYVNGELWNFESEMSVRVGEELTVSLVDGLKIHLIRRT